MRPIDVGRKRNGNPSREYTLAARLRKNRWQRANHEPTKAAARRAVRKAVDKGVLVPPTTCNQCGRTAIRRDGRRAIQAHHYLGYDMQLSVSWLCPKCHKKADAAMKATP